MNHSATTTFINVADYGATGTGLDDTTHINNALAAASFGSVIFFPPGVYGITSAINIPNQGLKLLGASNTRSGTTYSSTLKQLSTSTITAGQGILQSAGYGSNATHVDDGCIIEDLWIDGNSSQCSHGHGLVLYTYQGRATHVSVINTPECGIVVTGTHINGTSATGGSTHEVYITQCYVENPGKHGIAQLSPNADSSVTDNFYIDNTVNMNSSGLDCIYADTLAGCIIRGNHVYGGLFNGINCMKCWSSVIAENYIDDYGTSASTTATYVQGINVQVYERRGAIVYGNNVNCLESNTHFTYQGIALQAQSSDEKCTLVCFGNIITGNNQGRMVGINVQNNTAANTFVSQVFGNSLLFITTPYDVESGTSGSTPFMRYAPLATCTAKSGNASGVSQIGCYDNQGTVQFTATNAVTTPTEMIDITFTQPTQNTPTVLVSQADNAAYAQPAVASVSTTGFKIYLSKTTASTVYHIAYSVQE